MEDCKLVEDRQFAGLAGRVVLVSRCAFDHGVGARRPQSGEQIIDRTPLAVGHRFGIDRLGVVFGVVAEQRHDRCCLAGIVAIVVVVDLVRVSHEQHGVVVVDRLLDLDLGRLLDLDLDLGLGRYFCIARDIPLRFDRIDLHRLVGLHVGNCLVVGLDNCDSDR